MLSAVCGAVSVVWVQGSGLEMGWTAFIITLSDVLGKALFPVFRACFLLSEEGMLHQKMYHRFGFCFVLLY